MKLASLGSLLTGIVIPPWFLEALGGVGTGVAYLFGRMSKQDVSDSKLGGVIDTVNEMGKGVKVMGEASAARQEQIANLQRTDAAQWAEINGLRSQISTLSGQVEYLKGQLSK